MLELVGFEEIVAESVAEFYGDVFHPAGALTVFLEMVVDTNPFLVVSGKVLVVVGEEVLFRGVTVDEAEVAVEDGEFALGADSFCGNEFLFVHVTVFCGARLVDQVNAEVFTPGHLVGLGVADCRVVVQIEGYLAGREQAFA